MSGHNPLELTLATLLYVLTGHVPGVRFELLVAKCCPKSGSVWPNVAPNFFQWWKDYLLCVGSPTLIYGPLLLVY